MNSNTMPQKYRIVESFRDFFQSSRGDPCNLFYEGVPPVNSCPVFLFYEIRGGHEIESKFKMISYVSLFNHFLTFGCQKD